MRRFIGGFAVLLVVVVAARANAGLYFYDDFEGSSLDPFWETREWAGSITFPSTAEAHSGTQCVQFNSVYGAGQKNIALGHYFAAPIFGSVSVWVYDTGADVSSSNYLSMQIGGTGLGGGNRGAILMAGDYDFGGGVYGYATYESGGSWTYVPTTIDRTQGWHQWETHFMPDGLTLKIDGSTVYTDSVSSYFGYAGFAMYGPSWRPAYVSYWDDFAVSQIPEPSTFAIWCLLGVLGITVGWWRRRGA